MYLPVHDGIGSWITFSRAKRAPANYNKTKRLPLNECDIFHRSSLVKLYRRGTPEAILQSGSRVISSANRNCQGIIFSLIFVSCVFSMTLVWAWERVFYFFSSRSLNQRLFLRCLNRILNIFSNISFLIYWIFPSGSNDYILECVIRFKRIFKWCLRFFALIEFSNRNLTEFFDKTERKRESARNVGLILPSTCLILLTHFFSHSYDTAIYNILRFPSGGVFNFKQFLDLCL